MGMYLMRQIGREASTTADLPDFMVFLDWKALPWYWQASTTSLLRAGAGGAGAGGCWPASSAASRSARASRACTSRSSPRRSPTPRCCCSSATTRASAATTASPTSSASWASRSRRRPDARRCCSCITGAVLLVATLLLARWLVTLAASAACWRRSATPRAASMFCGYNPVHYKLFVWTRFGGAVRHRRGALRAAGGHHQSGRNVDRRTRSRSRSGWRSAGAARSSARSLGALLVNGAKSLLHQRLPGVLAVLSRGAVRRW